MSRFPYNKCWQFCASTDLLFLFFSLRTFLSAFFPKGISQWWKYIIKTIFIFFISYSSQQREKVNQVFLFITLSLANIYFPFLPPSLIQIDRRVQKVISEIVYCIKWYLRRAWVAKTFKWDLYPIEITFELYRKVKLFNKKI